MAKNYKEQLNSIRSSVPRVTKNGLLPNVNQLGRDGEDHINVGRYGHTRIGKDLDFETAANFNHDVLGSFRSINSLWYFLKANVNDDRIRRMTLSEVRGFIYNECGGVRKIVPNFFGVILHSIYLRIKADKGLFNEVVRSKKPFDMYRELPSGLRERLEIAYWLVPGLEKVREALRNDVEPDLSDYLDSDPSDIYGPVIAMLQEPPPRDPKQKSAPREKSALTSKPAQSEVSAPVVAGEAKEVDVVEHIEPALAPVSVEEPVAAPSVEVEAPATEAENTEDEAAPDTRFELPA